MTQSQLKSFNERFVTNDKMFTGSIPKIYQRYLVPLIFESSAADLVKRLSVMEHLDRILEIASGTGVVTRAIAAAFPNTKIVATDINQAMLDEAKTISIPKNVEFLQADAQQLPFEDKSFDAVVCQYGVMFFPDKPKAFSEAKRVLKPGGLYLFNVWDRLIDNEFPHIIAQSLVKLYPNDPPNFLTRTPYSYNDPDLLRQDLLIGGFTSSIEIDTVTNVSQADNADIPAIAFCQGTPLRLELEQRGGEQGTRFVEVATSHGAKAIRKQFGNGVVNGKIQYFVVTIHV